MQGAGDFNLLNFLLEGPISICPLSLTFKARKLTRNFGDDVTEAEKVLFCKFDLAEGSLLLDLKLCYPCCFLDEGANVVWFGLHNVADLAFFDNGIVAMPDSDIHEELAYIHPTTRDLVYEIFAFS